MKFEYRLLGDTSDAKAEFLELLRDGQLLVAEGSADAKARFLELLSKDQLRRLTKYQKGTLIYALKRLDDQAFDILKRIWGQTPSQAVPIMAQEFADRFGFGNSQEQVSFVIEQLSPSHSWLKLDLKISSFVTCLSMFCIDYSSYMDDCSIYQMENFWDRMRELIGMLPQLNRVKPSASQSETANSSLKREKPKFGWDYQICPLCWRTVPVNINVRRGTLCGEHDQNPNELDYRKRTRLKQKVNETAFTLRDQLKAEYVSLASPSQNIEQYQRLNLFHLLCPLSPLKNLVEYISGQIKEYDWVTTKEYDWKVVLEKFHGPFPERTDPLYREAMDLYIDDRLSNSDYSDFTKYRVSFWQMALAEAWLAAWKIDRRRKTSKAPETSS